MVEYRREGILDEVRDLFTGKCKLEPLPVGRNRERRGRLVVALSTVTNPYGSPYRLCAGMLVGGTSGLSKGTGTLTVARVFVDEWGKEVSPPTSHRYSGSVQSVTAVIGHGHYGETGMLSNVKKGSIREEELGMARDIVRTLVESGSGEDVLVPLVLGASASVLAGVVERDGLVLGDRTLDDLLPRGHWIRGDA